MAHLRKMCSAAAAFSMLLRLKVYLKSAYGLTAARCQSYKPNEATKVRMRVCRADIHPPQCCEFFFLPEGSAAPAVAAASMARKYRMKNRPPSPWACG